MYVISLGGSLIVKKEINVEFLRKFRNFILNYLKKGKRFIIVVGGGKTARKYQLGAKKLKIKSKNDLDRLGITVTRLNAYLVYLLFKKYSFPQIIDDPQKDINFKEKILIACGWKPGFSTDYVATFLAKKYKTKFVINLTNVDYVYVKRKKRKIGVKTLSWDEYLRIIPKKWKPGLFSPFDPVASQLAKRFKIKCIILNGNNLALLKEFLEKGVVRGTLIG